MDNPLEVLQGIDIYLLDQMMKGRLVHGMKVLDAGCGYGRNIRWLLQNKYDVTAIDDNAEAISELASSFPAQIGLFEATKIEDFVSETRFNFIICNAVLHFAEGHAHFEAMFRQLAKCLAPSGTLFIRMTSNIGLEGRLGPGQDGIYPLPDGSIRYLLTRPMVDALIQAHTLQLLEPVKTVFVDGLRSMTTLVIAK